MKKEFIKLMLVFAVLSLVTASVCIAQPSNPVNPGDQPGIQSAANPGIQPGDHPGDQPGIQPQGHPGDRDRRNCCEWGCKKHCHRWDRHCHQCRPGCRDCHHSGLGPIQQNIAE